MACAALVQVGPARQSFWALYRRERDELRERTRMLPRARASATQGTPGRPRFEGEPGRLLIDDGGVVLDVRLSEEAGFRAYCPHGRQHVWTRKQAGIAARGTLAIDGGEPQRGQRARGDRRHRRLPRAPHRVVVERRRRPER